MKLIGALVGNAVAILVVFAASKGLATCPVATNADSCTILGFTTAQVTGAVILVLNSVGVFFAPPNAPPTA